jgi:CRISPR-associated protein Csm1
VFGMDELRAVCDYARALLAAGISGTPLPPAVAERWEPYHRLLGEPAAPGRRLAPVFAGIGGGCGPLVLPRAPLALTRAALFPVEPAGAATAEQTADWRAAEAALAGAIARAGAATPAQARHAIEPVAACMQRFGANLAGTLAGAGFSVARQFALATALFAASGGGAPAATVTLVGSDTPGIQRFIGGGRSSKGAARGLRGRSVFLQLAGEAVAQRLLDALDLPRMNLIYAAGGNLLLLAPAGADGQLLAVRRALSAALLEWSGGEIDQALAWTEVATTELGRDIRPARGRLGAALAIARRRPYADLLAGDSDATYDRLFAPARDAAAIEQLPVDDYDALAGALGHAGGGLYLHRRPEPLPAGAADWQRALHALSGGWRYEFRDQPRPAGAPVDHLVDAINAPEHAPEQATGIRWLATVTPRDPDGSIRELASIAGATPMGRIGVLRMDVDGLGRLFAEQLTSPTLAATAALSAALEIFFAGWLDELCRQTGAERALAGAAPAARGDLLYTIYSGGDDLFIAGAWDRLPPLADAVRRDFAAYCGDNPALSVSGGIAIEDERFPLHELGERAGAALEAAKAFRHPGRREKDALALFEVVVPWERFDEVRALVDRLTPPALAEEPAALLGRLRDLALLDGEERRRLGLPPADPLGQGLTLIGRAHWRGLVALQRAIEQQRDAGGALRNLLDELYQRLAAGTLTPYLELAARWADFLWRPTGSQERR